MTLVHPLIQTARGHITDQDWLAAERTLGLAVDAAKDLEAEVEHLRQFEDRGDWMIYRDEYEQLVAKAAEVERLRKALEHAEKTFRGVAMPVYADAVRAALDGTEK